MSGGFYRAFEDRYRGARSIIRERLTVYLPFIKPLLDAGMATALDLGCGRGEWLELLGEAGFAAEGVDMDEGMLAACRERGLDVLNGDALTVLSARADASLAVVTAFHLVEHISFEQVQDLIHEALRVLQPGGLLILETPNPENLVVGASSFYDDPSHLRPIPPKLLAFAVEYAGFARHNILRLQESTHVHGDEPLMLFDVLSGVSPDYSVVAQKASAPAALAALDTAFSASYGVELHALAQRYQQQQDTLRIEFGQLRDQQAAFGIGVQQQMALIDSQLATVHTSAVAMAADIARHHAVYTALDEQLRLLDAARLETGTRFEQAQTVQARLESRLDQLASRAQSALTAGESAVQSTAKLRSRISELEGQHQAALAEHPRLAAHVAWIEGRLTHAEAEAAALRNQLSELLHRRGVGVRIVRALRHGPRRLAGAAMLTTLRRPTYALLRRMIQTVLRRPALKRVARRMIARFPQLHTRLLHLMYAPTPVDANAAVDSDPLAAEMSPRSLRIYRAMLSASKHKD